MLRKQEVSRKTQWLVLIGLTMLALMSFSLPAAARSGGVTGYSGKNGSTCASCHGAVSSSRATLTGPATVTPGSTNTYTFSGPGTVTLRGIDIAASGGVLIAGAAPQSVSGGEIIQTSSSSTKNWSFTWTAPITAGNVTVYGAGVDGYQGTTYTTTLPISVTAAATAPSITTQPANRTVTAGQTASFSVVAAGTAPLSYQWRKGGVNIAGATSSSYTTPATTTADNGALFSVVVSNGTAPNATSNNATLTVNAAATAPSITTQPASQTVTAGQTASFSVVAAGTTPLSYQWRKGGVNIAGATSSSYTTPATTTADNGALFSVVVSNGTAPNATSNNATLTVNAATVAPSITTQPANRTVTAGQTASFSVVASGTTPLSYQWRKGGVNIAGATSSSYTTPATTTADNGALFSVVVSNGTAPNATSNNATLTVNAATSPTLTVSPSSLSFAYTAGGTATGAKTISVNSSGAAVAYTVSASGGSWLSASGAGSTPGTVTVTVNTSGLSAGTYTGSVSAMPAVTGLQTVSAQTVPVTLTVTAAQPPPTGGGRLRVNPTRLVFYAQANGSMAAKTIAVRSSTGSAISFTAEVHGGPWVSVTPSGGTTPGTITVSAYATGMTGGTYSGVVKITSGSSIRRVAVVMVVSRSHDDDGEEDDDARSAVTTFTFDPGAQEAVNAGWLDGAGVQVRGTNTASQGLVLSKKKSAAATALAGATINGAAGSQLSQLGFDLLAGSECTAQAPQFVVISDDHVEHVANCANGSIRRAPAAGWNRVRFNPTDAAQLTPPLQPGTAVTTIALVMDHIAGKGIAVLDNININGSIIK